MGFAAFNAKKTARFMDPASPEACQILRSGRGRVEYSIEPARSAMGARIEGELTDWKVRRHAALPG